MIKLKGGYSTKDRRLDRLPQFHPKSKQFPIRTLVAEKPPKSNSWAINTWLDQGQEGRCAEYSLCHDLLARPAVVERSIVDDILVHRLVYWPAQEADQWPGGSYPGATPQYEGTSVLAAVQTATKLGLYAEYRWAFSLQDAVVGLGHVGPLLLGINWYPSMGEPDADGWVKVTGEMDGGHAILAQAVKIVWLRPGGETTWANVDVDHSWIVLHNSWGKDWGVNGRCRLTLRDFDRLRKEDGEVCIITRRLTPKSVTPLPL